jgi:hypothetical protein
MNFPVFSILLQVIVAAWSVKKQQTLQNIYLVQLLGTTPTLLDNSAVTAMVDQ